MQVPCQQCARPFIQMGNLRFAFGIEEYFLLLRVYVSAVDDVFLGKRMVKWICCYNNKMSLKTQLLRKVVSTRYSE